MRSSNSKARHSSGGGGEPQAATERAEVLLGE